MASGNSAIRQCVCAILECAPKALYTTTHIGEHLDMEMDFEEGVFRAPVKKLKDISVFAKIPLCTAASTKRWVLAKALDSLAKKAHFMYMAFPMARFYLRELHDVVSSVESWSDTAHISKKLNRDLEWWRHVPTTATPTLRPWSPPTYSATRAVSSTIL